MLAYFEQSKINCNTIYWIIAIKAYFNEHTKNNEVKLTELCYESYILGMLGLIALDDEVCKQNYFLLHFNTTGFIRYKLYAYFLCPMKPVTGKMLH